MKLTSKLSKHSYDTRFFFETIDYAQHGSLKFVQFLTVLKERFNLYFSEHEIEALFLYLKPEHNN